jgi:rubrerythrin
MANKYDDEKIREIDLNKLDIDDVEDLMTAKYEVEFKDTKYCLNCKHIFSIYDIRYEDTNRCPYCNAREDEIANCCQDDLDYDTYKTHINNVLDIEDDVGKDIVSKIIEVMKKEEGVNKMSNKMNLQEATIKALYDGLKDNTEMKDVEGLIDDVLVVTDPEITTDEFNEVIERAEEIMEETPEGDIPLDPTYLGEYLQICPICGGSFIEDHILEAGTACPICYETPEGFVMVGKLQAEDEVATDNGLTGEELTDDNGEELPPVDIKEPEESEEPKTDVPTEEPEEETEPEETETSEEPENNRPRGARVRRNREVASKQLPQGNILTEQLQEDKELLLDADETPVEEIDSEKSESVDKEYTLEVADEEKIRDLANNSAFTWEGMSISDDNLQAIVDSFKEETDIILPVHFYTFTGETMNTMYGLTEHNAYPKDLNFLSIDLSNWSSIGKLPVFKMKVGARWLDDIVDNNKVRQDKINGIDED